MTVLSLKAKQLQRRALRLLLEAWKVQCNNAGLKKTALCLPLLFCFTFKCSCVRRLYVNGSTSATQLLKTSLR